VIWVSTPRTGPIDSQPLKKEKSNFNIPKNFRKPMKSVRGSSAEEFSNFADSKNVGSAGLLEGAMNFVDVASTESQNRNFQLTDAAVEFGSPSQTPLDIGSHVPFEEDYNGVAAPESPEGGGYLVDEPSSETGFEQIVGRSAALRRVLREVEVVAPTDSGVLIQGETGTGKELIAHAVHNRSGRCDRAFVKVNCAAIPSGLLESELFGHEKGAFTGAIMRKPGRFELADKGTLFLDEVGDIPLELQAKLLRVLQEHEFERLGSTRTQQVDVRVIAVTHRDLKQKVQEGTFRSDLYYRVHVFPLTVPPLRERREDIPLIVRHFVGKFSQRMNRHIETISPCTMEALRDYAWPGNIRELQNFIERAVILSPGTSLRAPLDELTQGPVQRSHIHLSILEQMERKHVLQALQESNWVIGGPKGAASKLGMKRTTLAYRIRKLGISVRPQL
jgi:formate hydrogenlyase transcriptional activator